MKTLQIVSILVFLITSPVDAAVPEFGSDAPTYQRRYSAAHLASHPSQQVVQMQVTNELADLVLPLPGEMNGYSDAHLVGEIVLRDGKVLTLDWTCRADPHLNGGQLTCIPMDEELWNAMGRSTIAVTVPDRTEGQGLSRTQMVRFPDRVAFFEKSKADTERGAQPIFLGPALSGPEGDSVFRLYLKR
jgi:hypothetical protein